MAERSEPTPIDLVIRHGHVLTVNAGDEEIPDGAVAVDNGRIVAVGATAVIDSAWKGRSTIDALGGVVRPGSIDAHIHVSQYTSRSVLPRMGDGPVNMGHWKAELRPEDEHASAALASIDYLRCGFTGFVDPGTIFEPEAVARVAGELGIRIWLTDPYVADQGRKLGEKNPELVAAQFLARWPSSTEEAARRVGSQLWRNADEQGLARAFVGIYGEFTESDALRAHALKIARANGVQFQQHLGYTPAAYRDQAARLGRTPLAEIDRLHGLASDVTLVHMNDVGPDDEALLLERQARLVWCPYGTLQAIGAGSSCNRMAALARNGARVAVATDIPRVVTFDALAGLTIGCAAATGSPLGPRQVLRMLTRDAAASVGAERMTGSIEVGKSADIVVHRPLDLGVDPVWESAVLAGRHSIEKVLVRGRTLVENGRLTCADDGAIVAAARRSITGLLSRTGLAT
jgi:5-methylthioadenosine/S-adenosylhomocysteine deaminase